MNSAIFTFPCVSFRKIPLFSEAEQKQAYTAIKRYIAIIDVSFLPNGFPKETNPRDVKTTTNVAKEIKNSLENNEFFHVLNRGILISVKNVKHNNITSELSIDFGNDAERDSYGIIDGGHTYEIIQKYLEAVRAESTEEKENDKRYVSLEIFKGIDEVDNSDITIAAFASARNSSVPVDQKSLKELEGKFEMIKQAIKNETYKDNIGYKQNSTQEIDVREVIALMTVFNAQRYTVTNLDDQPVKAYSQREECLKEYLLYEEEYKKLCNILPKILELSDYIRYHVPMTWNKLDGRIGTKLNKIKSGDLQYYFKPELNSIGAFDTRLKFWLWLPILAAMRVLVDYQDDGTAFFKIDPIEFYENNAETFVKILYQNCKSNFVPNRVGKDRSMWTSLLQAAWMQAVQKGIIVIKPI